MTSASAAQMNFSTTFVLLQQEAYLARGALSVGLTDLRNAAFPDKATFYSGFFNTSIALERVMKLVVVTDHMLKNAYKTPTKAQLKAYGHDLVSLYASCVAAAARHGVKNVSMPQSPSLEREVLEFFSEFATYSRYYNLDALRTTPQHYVEPLARWGRVLNAVLAADTPKTKVKELRAQAKAMHSGMKGSVRAVQHGMDGSLLPLQQVFSLPIMHSLATPYAMVRLFNVLTPLLVTVGELGNLGFYGSPRKTGPHVPVYSEFFVDFDGSAAEIRRKKRWP